MKDVMIDIETLSTNSNGVIVSISAVQFDLDNGVSIDSFELGLDIQQQMDKGAVIDGDTVMWWMGQSDEAQKQLLRLKRGDVSVVLVEFNKWLCKLGVEPKNIRLWGNGSVFDNVMVRNLYKRHGVRFALPYWCDHDVRTLVSLKGIIVSDFKFTGIKHHGIDDCLHQIKYCCSGA